VNKNCYSHFPSFFRHLIELLPVESAFSQHVLTSDLATYFNEAEISELAVDDADSNNLYLHDMAMEDATAMTSYPSTRGRINITITTCITDSHFHFFNILLCHQKRGAYRNLEL